MICITPLLARTTAWVVETSPWLVQECGAAKSSVARARDVSAVNLVVSMIQNASSAKTSFAPVLWIPILAQLFRLGLCRVVHIINGIGLAFSICVAIPTVTAKRKKFAAP